MVVFLRSHVDRSDKLVGNAQSYQIELRETIENVTTRVIHVDFTRFFATSGDAATHYAGQKPLALEEY